MSKVKLYLTYRKKSYLFYMALYMAGFIVANCIFGPPKHYVVPILLMILVYSFLEFREYKSWKKENY